eukprot:CAMPEP_0206382044 /NCGR_PEP_ID=MMETSP0294-20121207/13026_1 /ASSEMBLY_ACC=CAM_ASM_000327 /TAXON_ID=39354 /ORGANISM="Heterosigma akashiwo, Strain CCMP2393" /LENGTH=100 /DNA_ID=CAMNT_0053831651 /DNA_START=194 /DNA_END=496 /DNA_ORIENTATION=-
MPVSSLSSDDDEPSRLHRHGVVVLHGGDHGLDELQEDEQVLLHFRLAPPRAQPPHNPLHHSAVLAWMYGRMNSFKLGVVLHCDSLPHMILHDIFKNLICT